MKIKHPKPQFIQTNQSYFYNQHNYQALATPYPASHLHFFSTNQATLHYLHKSRLYSYHSPNVHSTRLKKYHHQSLTTMTTPSTDSFPSIQVPNTQASTQHSTAHNTSQSSSLPTSSLSSQYQHSSPYYYSYYYSNYSFLNTPS